MADQIDRVETERIAEVDDVPDEVIDAVGLCPVRTRGGGVAPLIRGHAPKTGLAQGGQLGLPLPR